MRDEPTNEKMWTSLAAVQIEARSHVDALASLRRAVSIYPDSPKAHELFGLVYLRTGQADSARVAADWLRRNGPDSSIRSFVLAEVLRGEGRYEESAVEAKSGLQRDEQFEPLYISLVTTYERMGRKADAVSTALHALETLPKSATLDESVGPVLVEGDQWASAIEVYRALVRSDPSWSNANYLAWSLLGRYRAVGATPGMRSPADLEEAVKLSEQAVGLAPAEMRPFALDTRAQVEWEMGDRSAAVRTLETLVAELPRGTDGTEFEARLSQYREALANPDGSAGRRDASGSGCRSREPEAHPRSGFAGHRSLARSSHQPSAAAPDLPALPARQ